ncbi:hypothetical protein [Streptomyces sp. NPDC046939]|uniref:hypothetical protein n=1 Tax=Streptomyces sp. NPDC046939 TaxID=3155376 RepID=UPI00340B7C68
MMRNVVGSVLALVGAAAAVWSPFRAWNDGRRGRAYRLQELFSGGGVTNARAELFGSLFLPFVLLALLALLGLVLRSRLLVALAGLVVLGFTVLWMVRVAQAEDQLVLTGNGHGLGDGVAAALGGGVLLLLGALVMSGRHPHRGRRGHAPAEEYEPGDGYAEPPAWQPPPPAPPPAQPPVTWGNEATAHEATAQDANAAPPAWGPADQDLDRTQNLPPVTPGTTGPAAPTTPVRPTDNDDLTTTQPQPHVQPPQGGSTRGG